MVVRIHNGVLGHLQLKRKCSITFSYKRHNNFIDYKETSSSRILNVQNRHKFLCTVLLETEEAEVSSRPSMHSSVSTAPELD